MSEARALTNFAGNAVATVLVGTWTREIDKDQARQVLAGEAPFDETTCSTTTRTTPTSRRRRRRSRHEPAASPSRGAAGR